MDRNRFLLKPVAAAVNSAYRTQVPRVDVAPSSGEWKTAQHMLYEDFAKIFSSEELGKPGNAELRARIVGTKPALYHYTRPTNLIRLLESKSLLARPTSDFKDEAEYVHGLCLIRERLKHIRTRHEAIPKLDSIWRRIYDAQIGKFDGLVDRVIACIEYEINNASNPKIEVYVACLSTVGDSEKMVEEYGSVVIAFNALLPFIAYCAPKPFFASMLTRVSYNDDEFIRFIDQQLNLPIPPAYVNQFLSRLSPDERCETLSVTIAECLCIFAPNIKKPHYSYENEWRLKSVLSRYGEKSLLNADVIGRRAGFGLPPEAAFSDQTPRRYYHRLTCKVPVEENPDRFIIEGFGFARPAEATDIIDQVMQWKDKHAMGPVNLAEVFSKLPRDS